MPGQDYKVARDFIRLMINDVDPLWKQYSDDTLNLMINWLIIELDDQDISGPTFIDPNNYFTTLLSNNNLARIVLRAALAFVAPQNSEFSYTTAPISVRRSGGPLKLYQLLMMRLREVEDQGLVIAADHDYDASFGYWFRLRQDVNTALQYASPPGF